MTGTFELAGQGLEPAADLGDLFLAAVARVFRIDELDVIDHDQADLVAPSHAAGAGGDLKHVPRGRVVDEDRFDPCVSSLYALLSWVRSRDDPGPCRS